MRCRKEGHGHQTKGAGEHASRPRRALPSAASRAGGEALDPDSVRSEHPRPQFARDRFTSLNGWWDYAFVPWGSSHRAAARCVRWAHPRALLARVPAVGGGAPAQPDELLWYVRRVPVPALGEGERCLLHFEAVDFACACCVNGQVVGTHEGGYLPFPSTSPRRLRLKCSCGAKDAEPDVGASEARVGNAATGVAEMPEVERRGRGRPDLRKSGRPGSGAAAGVRGRPVRSRSERCGYPAAGQATAQSGGIWYTAQSGIWQPVWMEVVPARRVLALALHPDADAGTLTADVDVSGDAGLVRIYVCDPTGRQVAAGAASPKEGSVPVGEASSEQAGRPARVRLRLDLGRCAAGAPTTRVFTTSPCASAPMSCAATPPSAR